MSKGASRKWEDLEVSEGVKNFIKAKGFKKMTPVQTVTIPALVSGKDVAVEACTGSGKTLAFLIPVVEMLLKIQRNPDRISRSAIDKLPLDEKQYKMEGPAAVCRMGSLILSPTRELAQQTYQDLEILLKAVHGAEPEADLKALIFTGGRAAAVDEQIVRKNKCPATLTIWVGTPGRVMHLLDSLKLKVDYETKFLEILILDEADRLLSEEFSKHVSVILAKMPKQRRTGLFSATLTSETKRLTLAGMRYPVHIKVDGAMTPAPETKAAVDDSDEEEDFEEDSPEGEQQTHALPKDLQHLYLEAGSQDHLAVLTRIINDVLLPSGGCAIAFGLSCAGVDYLYRALSTIQGDETKDPVSIPSKKVHLDRLHGHLTQKQRNTTLSKFKTPSHTGFTAGPDNRTPRLLLCTDVAARGLDVKDLDLVIQIDAAKSPAEFVHRSGRAGRAGRAGTCLTLLRPSEDVFVSFMSKRGLRLKDVTSVAKLDSGATRSPNAADALFIASKLADKAALVATEKAVLSRVREEVLKDRELFLSGSKAFVTFIRAYQAHELSFIFPFHEVDLDGLARLYCLLRIPKVKELQSGSRRATLNVERWSTTPPDAIAFKDAAKEATRQEDLVTEKVRAAEIIAGKKLSREEALASAEAAAATLAERERREKAKLSEQQAKERTRTEKRDAKRRGVADEWEEMAKEERLAKKLKKGKMSFQEYEKALKKKSADDDSDSDDDLDEFDRIGKEMASGKKGGAKKKNDDDSDDDSDMSDSDDESDDSDDEMTRTQRHEARAKNAKAVPKWALRGSGTKGR